MQGCLTSHGFPSTQKKIISNMQLPYYLQLTGHNLTTVMTFACLGTTHAISPQSSTNDPQDIHMAPTGHMQNV